MGRKRFIFRQKDMEVLFLQLLVMMALSGYGDLPSVAYLALDKLSPGLLCLARRIQTLQGENIVKVSFVRWHAHALTKDEKLFKWGYSTDCRIGKVDDEAVEAAAASPIMWEPRLVEELQGVDVQDFACGISHSFVLCCNGAVLSCGNNVYGQFGGVNADLLETFPLNISSSCFFHPTSIGSGRSHCFPIADHIGAINSLVSWGWNRNSKLVSKGPKKIPRNSKLARKWLKA